MPNFSQPDLTVIIPTRDRPALLRACLLSLERQNTSRKFEVIVADDGRLAKPVALDGYSYPLKLVRSPQRGAAAARMEAAAIATAPILAFLDDDALADENWASTILDREPDLLAGALAITGRITPLQQSALSRARQARYDARQDAANANGGRCTFLAGGNAALSKDLFYRAGGFDTSLDMMHDGDLLRGIEACGGHCEYEERAIIAHLHVKGSATAFINAFRSGGYRMRILRAANQSVSISSETRKSVARVLSSREHRGLETLNGILNLVHLAGVSVFKLSAGRFPK